jgi:hypothetical protein
VKTITADTITEKGIEELVNLAAVATGHLAIVYGEVKLGDIGPASAAARIHDILRPLQIEPLPVRYFVNGNMVWRFLAGSIELRGVSGHRWVKSETFTSIDDLTACVDVVETPESKLPPVIQA